MKLPCTLNGKTILFHHTEKKLEQQDLLAWLESQSLYPKVFWKEKGSLITRAAVGSLLMFPSIPSVEGEIRLYGGSSFAEPRKRPSVWEGFPRERFWLPQIELSQTKEETVAVFYSFENSLPPLEPLKNKENLPLIAPLNRIDLPPFSEWEKALSLTLDAIHSKQIEKLVLARQTTWTFSSPPSLHSLLVSLQNTQKNATLFAFQLSPHHCFFGATPELLFERKGDSLQTEAIAGTRPRGKTQEEENSFASELLWGAKEQREFQVVKQGLEETLRRLATRLEWEGKDKIIQTARLQHLYNRLTAELLSGISDETLRQALHPTPALGGYPKEKALSLLREIEPFDRGWYGAPVGIVSPERTALYVAIRSCLLQGHQLHQFAGTGIVEGSVAKQEWEELDCKISSIRPFA
jgi:menaquinone-specific isochorismate synthase